MKCFTSVDEGQDLYIVYNEFSECFPFIGGASKFVKWANAVAVENGYGKLGKKLSGCLAYIENINDGGELFNFTVSVEKQTRM